MLTSLRFAKDLERFKTEVPYELFGYPNGASNRITNCEYMTVNNIRVHDIRSTPKDYGIDTTGFKYIHHKSSCELQAENFERAGNSVDNNPVVLAYLDETITLVKNELAADQVICFDWRFRRTGAPPSIVPYVDDVYDIRLQALAPGLDIHCDFSHVGGMERLEMHLLPEELRAVQSGRVRAKIINAWRPLNVVKNAPLVITDKRTVMQDDLMEVEKVLPDKVERNYYVKYQPYHEYFFMSEQGPEDVALFTTWDIEKSEIVADDYLKNPRESIEVRLIVLTQT